MTGRSILGSLLLAGVVAGAVACGASDSDTNDSSATSACEQAITIDAYKELVIVDDAVVGDARAKNGADGPWSFRYAVENMSPEGIAAEDFVSTWINRWASENDLNGFLLDLNHEKRKEEFQKLLVCPWLKQTEANGCNADCSTCTAKRFDLAKAPFRLIAITNRIDLRVEQLERSPLGEARLVFAITNGPADDPASRAMTGTVIFEYALPSSKTTRQWAEAWHKLGTFPAFDESYRAELASVTDLIVKRNAAPDKLAGSAIAQVRTSEMAFNWIWQWREFGLRPDGLRHQPLHNTPADEKNNSPELAEFIRTNADAIKKNVHRVPVAMTGGSTNELLHWTVPNVDQATVRAFAARTCNGCHLENPAVDTAFHISPKDTLKGTQRLSAFVRDQEVPARTKEMRSALCSP